MEMSVREGTECGGNAGWPDDAGRTKVVKRVLIRKDGASPIRCSVLKLDIQGRLAYL